MGLLQWLFERRRGPGDPPWSDADLEPYRTRCGRCGRATTTTRVAMEDDGFELCKLCRNEWVAIGDPLPEALREG